MNGAGSRDGFESRPRRPVDPAGSGRDATEELQGPGEPRRPRYTQRLPTFTPIGHTPGDETAVDAFAPVRQAPGDQDHKPGGGNGTAGGPGSDGKEAGSGRHRAGGPGRPRRARKPRRRRHFLTELVALVAIAITLALVIKTYVVQAFFIPSGSMENTLEVGDRVLINKLVYHTRGIARGDIVVFDGSGSWDFGAASAPSNPFVRFWDDLEGVFGESSGDIYIKRVIGLPGDHVACCNTAGQVTVNGVPLTEQSYLYPGNRPSEQKFSIVVPPGRLWVMGDHRDVSYDSRGHMGDPGGGTIPQSAVLGRAFVIIWPLNRWNVLDIPATFEQPRLTSPAAAGGPPAALAAALPTGTPVRQTWTPLPLALGFAGAVPLSWLQRRVRGHVGHRVPGRVRRHARRRLDGRRGPQHVAGGNTELRLVLYGQERGGGGSRSGVPCEVMVQHGFTPRRNAGLAAYENSLARAGLTPVAGIDEAGRGACAGPLVVAAVVLDKPGMRNIPGLADSKLLTPAARESAYALITRHAVDWHVVTVPAAEIDALGLHVCNVEGMRRAYAGLRTRASYVLTDGFPVRGLGSPALAVWKGDQVAASVAAASIVAKVTRDRMMAALDERYPGYGFGRHKGYVTDEHLRALGEAGPCPEHRRSFRCVPAPGVADGTPASGVADGTPVLGDPVLGNPASGRPEPGLEGE